MYLYLGHFSWCFCPKRQPFIHTLTQLVRSSKGKLSCSGTPRQSTHSTSFAIAPSKITKLLLTSSRKGHLGKPPRFQHRQVNKGPPKPMEDFSIPKGNKVKRGPCRNSGVCVRNAKYIRRLPFSPELSAYQ